MLTNPTGGHVYRADIDGLRAIAVALVVGFHAFPKLLPGGFIGVDVFFVISGYLISRIIFKELQTKSFSFVDFYVRRTRRIFPALIIVLLATLVAGMIILQDDEFSRLLKHIAGGGAFILNYLLAGEGGYFDRLAEAKPLLHLWSLSVEEQFYLVWPVLIWLTWRMRWRIWIPIVLFAVVSLIFSVYEIRISPINTFYLLKTRIWELLVGAGLAYVSLFHTNLLPQSTNAKNFLSVVGFALLLAGILTINAGTPFPGLWALLPVVSTFLLIASQADALVNKTLLSKPLLVGIGLISFPLYLWHWPIFSFARIYLSSPPSITLMSVLTGLSVALAGVTYWLIEKPIRRFDRARAAAAMLVLLLVAIVGTSYYFWLKPAAIDAKTQDAKAHFYSYFSDIPPMRWLNFFEKNFRHDCNFYQIDEYYAARPTNRPKSSISTDCFTPDKSKKHRVLIWGDSHAQMLNSGLVKSLPIDWQVLQVASSGCAARVDNLINQETEYCAHSNQFALDVMQKVKPDVVLVAQSTGHNIESMNRVAAALKKIGINGIIFVGPSPQWEDDLPKILIRRHWPNLPERTWVGVKRSMHETNVKLKNSFPNLIGTSYADVIGLFCNSDGCLTRLGNNSQTDATSWDYGHLTASASEHLARRLLVPEILSFERH